MEKDQYFEEAINWAQKHGFNNIKANYESYESPVQFSMVNGDSTFTPDITAYKYEDKYYIEIATKTDQPDEVVAKWSLLSSVAQNKGGKLFLLAPKGHKAFADRMIKKHRVDAQLVDL